MLLAVFAALAACRAPGVRAPLVVDLDRAPATLDPHHHNEVVGWSLLCNFYDALVGFSPEMRIEPALAESWAVLADNRLRFELRRGVRFADGAPFTSADVVASFERALHDPRSRIRHHLVGVRRVVADGDDAVVFETTGPAPTLVNRLAFLFVVPRSLAAVPEIGRPVGTGPYRFVQRGPNGSVEAEAWPSWRGMAEVRRVVFSFVEDEERRSDAFLSGGVDVSSRLLESALDEVERRQGLRVKPQPNLGVQLMVAAPQAAAGRRGAPWPIRGSGGRCCWRSTVRPS